MNPGDLVDPEETVEVGLIRTAIKGGFGFVHTDSELIPSKY